MQRGVFLTWCCQPSHPCGKPLLTRNSTGNFPVLAGSFGLVSLESLLFSSESWCVQGFICALQDWSLCFPQPCGSPVIKSHWPPRSDPQAWKHVVRLRTFTTMGELLQQFVLQFVGCPPRGDGIWFYHDCNPSAISLWLLLCLWTRKWK